jgi:hypothetical protein
MLLSMTLMDRRRFLIATASTAATAASLKSFAQTASAPPLQLAKFTLHPDRPGPTVPQNFIGLSYEVQQLSEPSFFSPGNSGLIAQFRALAPRGVLRLGGNTSDLGWWKPTPESTRPPLSANVTLTTPPGERSPIDLMYAITPEAVRNLRGFLDATGWTCLYGINLGTNTPSQAAEQAVFVAKTLGGKLECFQLGNEPDILYHRFRDRAKWSSDVYFDEWLAMANAIRARVPEASFGLPDIANNAAWIAAIAGRVAALEDRPTITAISHHYYFSGPPSNPKVNIDDLLRPDPRVLHDAALARDAATKVHTRYRMTEGNTCFRGGKPGVSDVFAASLWAADYLLTLASQGYAGVNLHGGEGKMVADSLGGTLPGELLMKDPTVPHPRPFYTPIADIDGKYFAEPVSYGMRFAQQFAGATIIPVDFDPGPVNATAYAAKRADGKYILAIINKDAAQELTLQLPSAAESGETTFADSLDSRLVQQGHATIAASREAKVGPHSMLLLTGFKLA